MKAFIRKKIRGLFLLLLAVFVISEAVPALEVYTTGMLSAVEGQAIRREDAGSRESRIRLAKKKKKKKKNNNNSSNNNNGSNGNRTGSSGSSTDNSQSNKTGKSSEEGYASEEDVQESADKNSQSKETDKAAGSEKEDELTVTEDGTYTSKEEVALYIHLYGHLPDNFITKSEAQDLGWSNREGNLDEVAPGKSIGGDRFGNYEGQLPEKNGRKYKECDIDFDGGYRGSKRIIFSNDGLIYYTEDHYKTFERLY